MRLEELARETDGFSPADLRALAQEAALCAMARAKGEEQTPAVLHEDFVAALERLTAGRTGVALSTSV